MKKIYALIGVLVLVGVVYFTGLYTYFIRTEINEELPMASGTMSASAMPTPQVLRQGSFGEVDIVHKGSGTAKIIAVDGGHILRLENFSVVNGPALYVYLTKTDQPTGKLESLGDFRDLGPLKATMGNQNYEIPGDITGYRTAVIWCKRYGVLFTYAVME
ncbi:MAG: DM13 domain-containing protein [Patescibacteria group bacterium]